MSSSQSKGYSNSISTYHRHSIYVLSRIIKKAVDPVTTLNQNDVKISFYMSLHQNNEKHSYRVESFKRSWTEKYRTNQITKLIAWCMWKHKTKIKYGTKQQTKSNELLSPVFGTYMQNMWRSTMLAGFRKQIFKNCKRYNFIIIAKYFFIENYILALKLCKHRHFDTYIKLNSIII